MLVAPCKNCNDRHPGCHSECNAYKEFNKKNSMLKDKIRKSKDIGNYLYGNTLNRNTSLKNHSYARRGKG